MRACSGDQFILMFVCKNQSLYATSAPHRGTVQRQAVCCMHSTQPFKGLNVWDVSHDRTAGYVTGAAAMPGRGQRAQSLPADCRAGRRRLLQEGSADPVRLCWETHTCIAIPRIPIRVADDAIGRKNADEITNEGQFATTCIKQSHQIDKKR